MDEDIQKYSRLRDEEFEKWCKSNSETGKEYGIYIRMFYAGFDAAVKALCRRGDDNK